MLEGEKGARMGTPGSSSSLALRFPAPEEDAGSVTDMACLAYSHRSFFRCEAWRRSTQPKL